MKEMWEIHWKDYYHILQVQPFAELEVIVKAYKALALKYHPDLNKDSTANSRMKDLTEAFEIISSPTKRREYDTVYRQKVHQRPMDIPSPIYKPKSPKKTKKPRGVDYTACKFYQNGKCKFENRSCIGKDKCEVWENGIFHKVCYVIILIISIALLAIPWYMYIATTSLKTLLFIIAIISSIPLTLFTTIPILALCHTRAPKLKGAKQPQ